jgi:hypothetical protein
LISSAICFADSISCFISSTVRNENLRIFVYRTEQALVPGAVARQPQQQAAGFIGRSDGALFKLVVYVVHSDPLVVSALKCLKPKASELKLEVN